MVDHADSRVPNGRHPEESAKRASRRTLNGCASFETRPAAARQDDDRGDSTPDVGGERADHRDALRLWLRLLTCTTMMEGEIRRRLRDRFDVTLPRFDLMAQLDKMPAGLTLSELSRRMMVSNGNLTGLVERLVASGHLMRQPAPNDRRAQVIRLTEHGRRHFRLMAGVHEGWVAEMVRGLGPDGGEDMMALLAKTKHSVRTAIGEPT